MPAYKYTLKSGKILWYATFYYVDWTGTKKHVCKRGFSTQREAKEYEQNFLEKTADRSDILFSALAENYMEAMSHRLRQSTMASKRYMIDTKLLPYFKNVRICDITSEKIIRWQNELLDLRDEGGNPYKSTYIRTIHNQMSAMMNYAVKHYGLRINPCHVAGSIGAPHAEEMNFWTKEQYNLCRPYFGTTRMRLSFDTLFYTGMRSGECLALTPRDVLDTNEINICKTYVKLKGVEYINETKTRRGKRVVSIPKSLHNDLKDYISMLYGIEPDDRIFNMTKTGLEKALENAADKAGLPRIRVHDLRHSNASMLIDMGVDIMEISRRLGHASVKTTWDTYGHLYPDKEQELASRLDELREDIFKEENGDPEE